MSRQDVDIRARCDVATPGPWETSHGSLVNSKASEHWMRVADMRGWGHLTGKGRCGLGLDDKEAIAIQEANAEFIVHSRQDIPYLLDSKVALEKELEAGQVIILQQAEQIERLKTLCQQKEDQS